MHCLSALGNIFAPNQFSLRLKEVDTVPKKLASLMFFFIFLLLPIACAVRAVIAPAPAKPFEWSNPGASLDQYLQAQYPFSYPLKKLRARLEYAAGKKEQNGIFYTHGRLIENIVNPAVSYTNQNTAALRSYTASQGINALFLLLPTACAVDQEELPSHSVSLFDQRTYLERVSQSLPKNILSLDAYPTLFSNRSQKQYYNTDPNFTPVGGYSIYTALCSRLGISPHALTEYSVENVAFSFLGSHYDTLPYFDVTADVLSLYRLQEGTGRDAAFTVERTDAHGNTTVQDGLYDYAMLDSEDPLQIYLGQSAPILTVRNAAAAQRTLLLFADDTARSYLPFLAGHYSSITWVNLKEAAPEQLQELCASEYDQTLFCYSIETYLASDEITNLNP